MINQGLIKILVVDDSASDQALLRAMLKSFSYPADFAASGEEALQLLEKNEYRLILMDILMPKMDGIETTKIIREKRHLNIPIIAITGLEREDYEDKCLAIGMNDFLQKPLHTEKLKQLLIHWLV